MLLKGKRIFIFEDDVANRAVMQLLLEQQRAMVAFERWGLNFADKLRAFAPIDIILLDLMYPGNVTGYDIFDEIRAMPEFEDVPIVAVSAADVSVAIPLTQEKGFSGFISKPIKITIFPQLILDVLNGEKIWHGA